MLLFTSLQKVYENHTQNCMIFLHFAFSVCFSYTFIYIRRNFVAEKRSPLTPEGGSHADEGGKSNYDID